MNVFMQQYKVHEAWIRLEISLKARAGVVKRAVWGKEKLVWSYVVASVYI